MLYLVALHALLNPWAWISIVVFFQTFCLSAAWGPRILKLHSCRNDRGFIVFEHHGLILVITSLILIPIFIPIFWFFIIMNHHHLNIRVYNHIKSIFSPRITCSSPKQRDNDFFSWDSFKIKAKMVVNSNRPCASSSLKDFAGKKHVIYMLLKSGGIAQPSQGVAEMVRCHPP